MTGLHRVILNCAVGDQRRIQGERRGPPAVAFFRNKDTLILKHNFVVLKIHVCSVSHHAAHDSKLEIKNAYSSSCTSVAEYRHYGAL